MLACDTVRQDPELRIIALAAILPVIDPHQLVDLADLPWYLSTEL
jgi:hypothetical protein